MNIKHKKYIALFVAASIAIKLVFLFASGVYQNPQTFEYERMAVNLLDGKGFYYEHFDTICYAGISPAYPALCYLTYKLFGHNPLYVVFIQILITSLLVVPVYFIARRIFNKETALLAALLCAIQPQLIVYSTSKLHSMSIYAFVFALLVLVFLRLRELPTIKNILIAGFIAGLAVLFRITCLAFILLGVLWFFVAARSGNRKKFQAAVFIALMTFLLLLPWGVRNYAVFGRPLFLQTNKWESLWYGNMPGSTGSLFTEGGVTLLEKAAGDLPPEVFSMNEIEQAEYLKGLVIGYFKEDPAAFVGRILKKAYYFWYFSPYQGSLYPKSWMVMYKAYYLLILFPAIFSVIYGFTLNRNADRPGILLIMLLFLTMTGTHSVYFLEGRHRWAIESVLLVFTANGFIVLGEYVKRAVAGSALVK